MLGISIAPSFHVPGSVLGSGDPSVTNIDMVLAPCGADSVIVPRSHQNLVVLCLIPSGLILHLWVNITVRIMNGLEVAGLHVSLNCLETRPLLEGLGPWGGGSEGSGIYTCRYVESFETPENLNWKIRSHFVFLQGEMDPCL